MSLTVPAEMIWVTSRSTSWPATGVVVCSAMATRVFARTSLAM